MIKVLIVDDSKVSRELITYILNSDPKIEVIGTAENGEMALHAIQRLKPDVVTMDIHMPLMNGFDATRAIMETSPVPIIIVSGSFNSQDNSKAFKALEAGALAVLKKPRGLNNDGYNVVANELIQYVKTMSEVKVVKRSKLYRTGAHPLPHLSEIEKVKPKEIKAIAIGASTGGPFILQKIFRALPKDLPVPVIVVQHMSTGFMESFLQWLSSTTGFKFKVAFHGDHPLPGFAYFAPDNYHIQIGPDQTFVLTYEKPGNGHCPSVSKLFKSMADSYGANALGVILTGMGRDGAKELLLMREQGAVTVAQDAESAVINGMPGEAVNLGAVEFVLDPDEIVVLIKKLVDPDLL